MTSRDWLRFAAAYLAGVVGAAVLDLAYSGILGGRPYRGVPTLALALGPLFAMTIAFGTGATSSATAPSRAFVIKVVVALVILGSFVVALVETFTHWEWGWHGAAGWVVGAALVHPLAKVFRSAVQ